MTRLEQIEKRLAAAPRHHIAYDGERVFCERDIAFLLDMAKVAQAMLDTVTPEEEALGEGMLRDLLAQEGPIDRVLQEGEEREA